MSQKSTGYVGVSSTSGVVPQDSYPIIPSDTDDLQVPVRAIRATGGGTVRCRTGADVVRDCTFAAGETRIFYVTKVYATGTDATGLEGMV